MESIDELIKDLRSAKVRVWAEDGSLRYSAPAGALTHALKARMVELKSGLVELLSASNAQTRSDEIEPAEPRAFYPLSSQQKRLFVLQQLDPRSTAYNLPHAFIFRQRIAREGVDRFREGIDSGIRQIVSRHEILRSRFALEEGTPAQFVDENPVFDIEFREGMGAALADEMAEFVRPFDLGKAPLLRLKIVYRGEDELPWILLDMHHIVSDGVSLTLLFKELDAISAGAELPKVRLHYKDYAVWQAESLSEGTLSAQKRYWIEQFREPAPALDLPFDFARPSRQSYKGALIKFDLEGDELQGMRRLCRDRSVTPYMALLAAFNILMSRYSGQEDVVVGTPVAGRDRKETESIFGVFVNTLAIRTKPLATKTVAAYLKEVKDSTLKAFDNQRYPFEELVEQLQVARDLGRNPIFDVMFNLHNMERFSFSEERKLRLTPEAYDANVSQLDLCLEIWESPVALSCRLIYCTDLFEKATAERMAERYRSVLRQIAAAPDMRIGMIDLCSEEERSIILNEFNSTAVDYPFERGLAELFEEQVERAPEAVAVAFDDIELDYRTLNGLSNALASKLAAAGVGRGGLVGIMAPRSPEMIVAILATLKAGAAYLPLDPAYPLDRIEYMLEDSEADVLLTLGGAPQISRFRGTTIDVSGALGSALDAVNPQANATASDLAYVIYTSGSTGKPKGVMVERRNVANFVWATCERIEFSATDRFLCATTMSFDIFVLESLLPLLRGMRVELVSDRQASDPGLLLDCIRERGVTVLQTTPSRLRMLMGARDWAASLRGVRKLLVGGEAFPGDLLPVLQRSLATAIYNMYGPTETTVWSTTQELTRQERISIGRPIGNTRVRVVGPDGSLAPIGVRGELWIGGAGVARGYLNRPDLTAERFVAVADEPGCVFYRTGDVAKWTPNGELECSGRLDHQVKIRGHRIELGEVESALQQVEGIADAAVVAREVAGSQALVAYYVSQRSIGSAELRDALARSLPDYMTPSVFVKLESLPQTDNGKVDRKALPDHRGAIGAGAEYVAPVGEVESLLAKLWSELLRVERVGAKDNFFALGGHSIVAIQLIDKINRVFKASLTIGDLFQAPDVSRLGAVLASGKPASAAGLQFPRIEPDLAARHEPFPLTDVQQAYWVGRSDAFELGSVATHLYFELEIPGLDLKRCADAWRLLTRRHDMLRAIALPDGTQRILENLPDYEMQIEDLTDASDAAAKRALEQARARMSHQVFRPDTWPLFEVRAFKLKGRRARLNISYDLLIGDGWSFRILEKEFLKLYKGEGELEPLSLSFRDYVLAERRLEQTAAYAEAEAYWKRRLADFPGPPQLPVAKDFRPSGPHRFKRRVLRVAPRTWRLLKEKTMARGLTPSGIVLAAYAETIKRWSASPRFVINLTLFRRLPLHEEVDRIVGDFTSLSLLEIDFSEPGPFVERARAVQARLWQDLQRNLFSGVRAQRELMRKNNGSIVLFPVVFTSTLGLQETEAQPPEPDEEGVVITKIDETTSGAYSITQTSQVWLDNQASESGGSLYCAWDALESAFPASALDDMFEIYAKLLHDLAYDEAAWDRASIAGLPESQRERRKAANDTRKASREVPLHTLFIEQAIAAPDRIAVIAPGVQLSYAELRGYANALSQRIQAMGARPNQLVAIAMPKGWEQVAAALGILQAGAAYLPLAADLPRERLGYLLSDAEVSIVVTNSRFAGRPDLPAGVSEIDMSRLRPDEAAPAFDAPAQRMEDLAYVIYTSGSTGKPKGVMIDHRGAVNTILDINRRFGIGAGDRALALSSLSFDLSVYDVFGMLAAGGAIVMPDDALRRDPSHWSMLMREHRVSIWNSVPALMQMLLDYCEGDRGGFPNSLRLALLSGDWIPLGLPKQARAFNRALELVSLGGATEASVWSIFHRIGEVDRSWKSIPYGRPLANQTFHALNAHGEDCPDLVPGELYIGGVGVAKGYWKDKAKTDSSFVAHPSTGERLYRTGDWGRYLPDGEIEFLGRQDSQVKVGGHRIELGEIEAALNEHPRVKDSIVCALGERDERRLVAYVIREPAPAAQAPRRFDPAELKSNPLDKLRFKRSRPALRGDGAGLATPLPRPAADSAFLEKFVSRRSYRDFRGGTIPLEAFSNLLSALMQADIEGIPLPKARYASAGSLYPIQFYFYIRPGKIEGLKGGIHYYNPREHKLIAVADEESPFAPALDLECAKFNPNAAFALFMIAKMDAIRPLYPDNAETFCLLEAGMATQLIETVAPEQNIGICQLGGYSIDAIRDAFALDDDHRFAHCLIGGAILPEQRSLGALRMDARPDLELLQALAKTDGRPRAQPSERAVETEDLRRSLGSKLPAYMVPKTFVFMEKFPLSGNGKVDRNALPAPSEAEPPAEGSDRSAPTKRGGSGEVESAVLDVWREVLGIETIGMEDNFFDLGGTSVHVIRAHAKLKERFDREIPIVEMFAKTTVSALVAMLDIKIEQPRQEQAFSDVFDRARRQRAAMRK